MSGTRMIIKVENYTDPMISKIIAFGVNNHEFRATFKRLVLLDKAFVFMGADNENKLTDNKLMLCLHPSDELLDAYYKAMGV